MQEFWCTIVFLAVLVALSGYYSFQVWMLPEKFLKGIRRRFQGMRMWPRSDVGILILFRIAYPAFFFLVLSLLVFALKDPAEYGFK